MKTKLLFLLMSILTISCNQTEKSDTKGDNGVFKVVNIEKSEFIKVGNKHQYKFIGNIQNTSENLFDKVSISVRIELKLDNGNIIKENDYNGGFSMFSGMPDSQTSWKPNENRVISGLGSGSGISSVYIPDHYFEYPIQKVYAVLKLDAEDLINRTQKDYELILDVTDKWREISQKPNKSKSSTYSGGSDKNEKQSQNFDLSKDSYENESAIIKEIKIVEGGVYLVVDIVQIEYSEDMSFEIINQNPKLRTYKVVPNVLIKDSQCLESTTSNYLVRNKERIKTNSPFGFVLITTNNKGELFRLNLGCWN